MKIDELKKVYKRCQEENADPVIFGDGNPDASILLIGEAPGAKEIEQGKPFVGQAGKNLDDFLEILELEREDIYITNVVKFRPYRVSAKTGKSQSAAKSAGDRKTYTIFTGRDRDHTAEDHRYP